jgi:hypothetical protein
MPALMRRYLQLQGEASRRQEAAEAEAVALAGREGAALVAPRVVQQVHASLAHYISGWLELWGWQKGRAGQTKAGE